MRKSRYIPAEAGTSHPGRKNECQFWNIHAVISDVGLTCQSICCSGSKASLEISLVFTDFEVLKRYPEEPIQDFNVWVRSSSGNPFLINGSAGSNKSTMSERTVFKHPNSVSYFVSDMLASLPYEAAVLASLYKLKALFRESLTGSAKLPTFPRASNCTSHPLSANK